MDVTSRRRAEDKFRLAVEASPSGIVLVDPSGRIELVNAETERLFGYTRNELIGRTVEMLVPERFWRPHPGHRAGFLSAPEARAMGATRELYALRKNGTEFPVEIGLSPIESDDGMLILTVIVDITARKKAEADAVRQRSELAHLSRVTMLGELSGSVAHELNQPLTAILSNAQAAQRFLAREPADLEEVRGCLADIVAEDKRAGEIIRRLRMLLRKGEVQQQAVDVNEIAQEVLKLIRSDLVNQGVAIHTEFTPGLPAVLGDRVQLQQVLINLLMNACDAMMGEAPTSRLVVISSVVRDGKHVCVSVSDQGGGVPSDQLEQVFEPFFTTKANGLGLGLSVCRTIISAHGGRLWASNRADRGATFQFTLPALAGAI